MRVCVCVYLIWCDWGRPTFEAWKRPGLWSCFSFPPTSAHSEWWPWQEEKKKGFTVGLVFSFLFCGLTLPPLRGLCWKTVILPVATKSWCHNLSLKKPELKQSRKWEQRQQVRKHHPGSGGTSAGLTGVVRVRLQAVDHVVVGFK